MAWTAPKTWTTSEVLFASDLNTYVTENLLTTAPALATQVGSWFVSDGENATAERLIQYAEINTPESTTSTSYTDLATVGPSVTITSGEGGAFCFFATTFDNAGVGDLLIASPTITGEAGNEAEAPSSDDRSVHSSTEGAYGNLVFYDGLQPGENTFTLKYRIGSGSTGTGTFSNRRIMVWPF